MVDPLDAEEDPRLLELDAIYAEFIAENTEPKPDVKSVRFLSTSNGRGRRKRKPREVELIGGPRKYKALDRDGRVPRMDLLAQEAGFSSEDEFLAWLRRSPNWLRAGSPKIYRRDDSTPYSWG